MVTTKNVVDVILLPSRTVDNFVLKQGARVLKKVPAVWGRIPQEVKKQLGARESPTRRTLDSIVAVGVPFGVLAIVDKAAGTGVAPLEAIRAWYANSTLLAAGTTTAAVTGAVELTNRAWHYIPKMLSVTLPKIGQTAYTTLVGTVAATFLIAYALAGPSAPAKQPVTGTPMPPSAAATATPSAAATPGVPGLTQQDLNAYVSNTLLPKIMEEIRGVYTDIGRLNEVQTRSLETFVSTYVTQQIAQGGFVTNDDLTGLQSRLQSRLEEQIRALRAQPTATAVPPTQIPATPTPASTPTVPTPVKLGQLEQYLQSSDGYVLPASVLQAAAEANLTGLAAALSLPAETLTVFTDGSDANGEFVRLVVTSSNVTVRANYGASIGQRDVLQRQTNPLALSVYLQKNLTPAQLKAITPVK